MMRELGGTRILLIGNRLFREALKEPLVSAGYEIVGEVGTIEAACDLVLHPVAAGVGPDLLIADLQPDEGNLDRLRQIHDTAPDLRSVVLTSTLSRDLLGLAARGQVNGYLLKDIATEVLIRSLHLVMLGQQIVPSGSAKRLLEPAAVPVDLIAERGLSRREAEVLHCLLVGHSNQTIARNLDISPETVRVHMRALLRKLGANNRTQAAVWAINHGYRLESA